MDQIVTSPACDTLANVRFDAGRAARARVGFVLIPNEQTIEEDMIRHLPLALGPISQGPKCRAKSPPTASRS